MVVGWDGMVALVEGTNKLGGEASPSGKHLVQPITSGHDYTATHEGIKLTIWHWVFKSVLVFLI